MLAPWVWSRRLGGVVAISPGAVVGTALHPRPLGTSLHLSSLLSESHVSVKLWLSGFYYLD